MHLQTVKGKGYSRGWCGTPHTPLSQACCSNRFCMLPTMHRWVSFSDPMASGTLCFAHQGEFRTTLQAALQCADMTWQCGHCLRCMMHMAWKVSLLLACQLDAVLPALRSNLVCMLYRDHEKLPSYRRWHSLPHCVASHLWSMVPGMPLECWFELASCVQLGCRMRMWPSVTPCCCQPTMLPLSNCCQGTPSQ